LVQTICRLCFFNWLLSKQLWSLSLYLQERHSY